MCRHGSCLAVGGFTLFTTNTNTYDTRAKTEWVSFDGLVERLSFTIQTMKQEDSVFRWRFHDIDLRFIRSEAYCWHQVPHTSAQLLLSSLLVHLLLFRLSLLPLSHSPLLPFPSSPSHLPLLPSSRSCLSPPPPFPLALALTRHRSLIHPPPFFWSPQPPFVSSLSLSVSPFLLVYSSSKKYILHTSTLVLSILVLGISTLGISALSAPTVSALAFSEDASDTAYTAL